MADYIAQARSNYFKVKNEEQFRKFCERYGVEIIQSLPEGKDGSQQFGFLLYESLPTGRTDDGDEWIETDFIRELSEQLAEGEVAVVMEIGFEKMRYLNGYACAVNSKGKTVEIGLGEIYQRAKRTFGVLPTEAEY